jgi:hypothetical protein
MIAFDSTSYFQKSRDSILEGLSLHLLLGGNLQEPLLCSEDGEEVWIYRSHGASQMR